MVVFRDGRWPTGAPTWMPAGTAESAAGDRTGGWPVGGVRLGRLLCAYAYLVVRISMSMKSRPCESALSPTGVQVFFLTSNVFSSVPTVMSTCAE